MRANGMLEMDSYRLAAYTVPCPCYICGGGNNFDAELCRHCHAPDGPGPPGHLAKDPSADDRRDRPVGRGQDGLSGHAHRHALAAGREHAAAGPRGVLDQAAAARDGRRWPAASFRSKTPNEPDRWHWVHCQVLRKKQQAGRADHARPGRRGAARRSRSSEHLSGHSLVPEQVRGRAWCWSMPRASKAARATKTSTR